jgi:hypothetical protein
MRIALASIVGALALARAVDDPILWGEITMILKEGEGHYPLAP